MAVKLNKRVNNRRFGEQLSEILGPFNVAQDRGPKSWAKLLAYVLKGGEYREWGTRPQEKKTESAGEFLLKAAK